LKKVIYLIDTLQTGGAEKSILEFSSRFKEVKSIVCFLQKKDGDLSAEFRAKNVELIDLSIPSSTFWLFHAIKSFNQVLKEHQPDIIHAHLYKSELVARLSKIPKSSILIGAYVNDSYSKERYNEQNFLRNCKLDFIKWIDKLTISKNDYITTITKTIASSNCSVLNYPIEKTVLIPRGRSKDDFRVSTTVFTHGDTFKFIIVARLLFRKGYLELIEAVQILSQQINIPFKVRVVGDGVDKIAIQKKVDDEHVSAFFEFLGTRKDVPLLLQSAHVFILPSHYEGQGGALVEAMFTGLPIICSDIPVFSEQVDDQKEALLFELKSPQKLAEKMRWVIENYSEARLLGVQARIKAEQNYDIDKIAKKTEDFYLDVTST
jgi:glycosyltransferase involved in cell wall biosynthesis